MNNKDYYEILGVEKNASQAAIKKAYRTLAFQYHPDKNKEDPAATQKMKDINEAYAVLSDPDKRQQYDLLSSQYGSFAYDRFRQTHTNEDIFRGSDIDQIFEEFARMFGFRNSRDIFRESYGSEYQKFQFHRPGAFSGGFVNRSGKNGGNDGSSGVSRMPELNGVMGKIVKLFLKKVAGIEVPERGEDRLATIKLEPELARVGGEVAYSYNAKNLMVKIPAGIGDGRRIRLKGMGTPGKAGGESGDLYLEVKTRKSFTQKLKNLFKA